MDPLNDIEEQLDKMGRGVINAKRSPEVRSDSDQQTDPSY